MSFTDEELDNTSNGCMLNTLDDTINSYIPTISKWVNGIETNDKLSQGWLRSI